MLKSMKIRNFQSHKNTRIKFNPGVNVIVGKSDTGKTAIFRAIYWLFYNKPNGDEFRSNWGGSTEIKMIFDNGKISRIKNSKFNGYKLNKEEYKGFSSKIPEQVDKFCNISDINFQTQYDKPFLIDWTPGERGAFLNKTTNLEIIDKTISNNKDQIKYEKRQIDIIETNIEDNEKKLKEFDDLEDLEKKVSRIESIYGKIKILKTKISDLEDIMYDINYIEDQINKTKEVLKKKSKVEKAEKIYNEILSISVNKDRLNFLYQDIKSKKSKIIDLKKYKSKKEREFKKLMPDICPLCERSK